MDPSGWVDVAAADDVRAGAAIVVDIGDVPVALVRTRDGALAALQNLCPHMGGPVGEGQVKGSVITCPWHGWQFDLASGRNLKNPAASVRTFPVREEGGRVLVRVEPS